MIGDLNSPNPPFENSENPTFHEVDVTSWESQRTLFAQAEKQYGRIDHVFANAGIQPRAGFKEFHLDDAGQLQPPDMKTIDVNLIGPIYTTHLARAYMTKLSTQHTTGTGSIVLAASTSSFQTFSSFDYTIAKHAVLGIIRGMVGKVVGEVRINAIAPSWTDTGIIPGDFFRSIGVIPQPAEAVARSVVLLFADESRHGDVIYSWNSQFREVNNAPGGLLENAEKLLPNAENEESVLQGASQFVTAQREAPKF